MTDNAREAALISQAAAAVGRYEHSDSREGGTYFSSDCVSAFQKIAVSIASLISEQGVEATSPTLVCIAQNVKYLDQVGYGHGNSLGFAFKQALGRKAEKNPNPFSGLRL